MDSLADLFHSHTCASLEARMEENPRQPTSIQGQDQSLFITKDKQHEDALHYRLFIDTFCSSLSNLHQIHQLLLSAESVDRLEIRLNNNGGSVSEGLRLMHVMENQFADRTTVVIEADALSMAAIVFAHGDQRVIHPKSHLMFHNYFTFAIGKGGEIIDRVKMSEEERNRIYKPILEKGYLSEDEYERMLDGKDIWLTSDQMIDRGLATHVMVRGEMVPVSDYQKDE